MSDAPLLEIEGLRIGFPSPRGGWNHPVDGVSLQIAAGQRIGIVGESGSGKSLTALACLGLVPEPGRLLDGRIVVNGTSLESAPESGWARVRGREIGLVLQEAADALNPVYTVGYQITEAVAVHSDQNSSSHRGSAIDLLARVAVDDPQSVFRAYPHELSGGLAQRVMLALALSGRPKILIADEPTSSLDQVTQKKILDLLDQLCREQGLALVLISHDLMVVGDVVDRVLVMYRGQIVEEAGREVLFSNPLHPYTRLLFDSVPGATADNQTGPPYDSGSRDSSHCAGCRFSRRCPIAEGPCQTIAPELVEVRESHRLRCPVVAAVDRGTHGRN